MNILKPSLALCLLALFACAPLPPAGTYYEARPEVHRVCPLMRDERDPVGTAYYEDQFGRRVAVYPDPEEFRRR